MRSDAPCQPSHYRIELFGGLRVHLDGQTITRFRTQKAASLLAFLAFYPRTSHPREQLVELFWPELSPEAGRDNLSTALSSLRRQLEPPPLPAGSLLLADRASVRLNIEVLTTDVAEFDALLAKAAQASLAERADLLEQAMNLYWGELLPAHYEDWAVREQTRYHERAAGALLEWGLALETRGETDTALSVLARAVVADPYQEETYLAQMRVLAVSGRVSAALEVYRNLARFLKEGMGASPAPAIRKLAKWLQEEPEAVVARMKQAHRQLQAKNQPVAVETDERASPTVPAPVVPASAEASKLVLSPTERETRLRLPYQLTRFFGREREIAELDALLRSDARVVTLTGPGGAGKTRLALEVARQVAPAFEGRVWFVSLAELPDASLILTALWNALELPPSPGADPLDRIGTKLDEAPSLLVLDNFEHLLSPAGATTKGDNPAASGSTALVRLLLQRAPRLTCFITSRQPLRIGGEQEVPLPPLAMPGLDPSLDELLHAESVALYVDRARAAKPDFALTQNNAQAVATLCRKLEGMPLAIEMAAAWARTLPPQRMLERLERQLDLLVSRRRDLPPRHQSLRATIEWSYDLLEPELRAFFARLSVFRGGWTLEAAEAVYGEEALDGLAALQDQSLIVVDESGEEPRYRMLETLREFASEKLEERGEAGDWRQRHVAYFVQMAEEAEPKLRGPEQEQTLLLLEAEHDNLRGALAWCQEAPERIETGLRMAGALARFWQLRSHLQEGDERLAALLARDALVSPQVRARALLGNALLSGYQDDPERPITLTMECLRYAREAGDLWLTGYAESTLGWALSRFQGRFEEAILHFEAGLPVARAAGDPWLLAESLSTYGYQRVRHLKDYDRAETMLEEGLALARAAGDRSLLAELLYHVAIVAVYRGNLELATDLYEEALAIRRAVGDTLQIGMLLNHLGNVSLEQGHYARARERFRESLQLARERDARYQIGIVLEHLALVAGKEGATRYCVRLCGAAEGLFASLGPERPIRREEYGVRLDAARAALGETFTQFWYEGIGLTLEQACALALAPKEAEL